MAIYIHCPYCHLQLGELQQDCGHCGAALPPGVLYALSASLGHVASPAAEAVPLQRPAHLVPQSSPAPAAATVMSPPLASGSHSALRPWLAATLSLICGLGQLYNGQIAKGCVLLGLGAITVVVIVTLDTSIAKVVAPLLWLYGVIDAYLVAR